jgi:hypothetical protein
MPYPLDLSDIVNSCGLAETTFTVTRSTTTQALGGASSSTATLTMFGQIWPATPETMEITPMADRIGGGIGIVCTQPILHTNPSGVADIVTWNSQRYRVSAVSPYQGNGFYYAEAIRMAGN